MLKGWKRKLIFAGILLLMNVGGLYGALRAYIYFSTRELFKISRTGWEAVYRERGLPVPPDGPREGYWGSRLGATKHDPNLGWILSEVHIADKLDIDAHGMEHAGGPCSGCPRVLIVGASTAFGAYASSIRNTYYDRLAADLAADGLAVDVTVLAAGAWKSVQEVKALRLLGLPRHPDVVLFLDGLNDLTNGSNAHTLYGVKTKTLDGSRWNILYNEHDYDERVRFYLQNMTEAITQVNESGAVPVLALQPASFEKKSLGPTEAWVEEWSLKPHESKARLQRAYDDMRRGLRSLAASDHGYFIDCTHVFDGETASVFTDFWHFPDRGHELLARYLADELGPILRARGARTTEAATHASGR